MGFDFDAFAGALRTLSGVLDKTAERIGMPREVLTRALCRHATARRDKWEATLWKCAYSDKELSKWIYRRARNFNINDESEVLKLADEIPTRIRRNLIEIAKSIPASHGGKPPALDLIRRWQAQRQVKELHDKGLSKDKAYEKVAKRMGVGAHTVRRVCDERERKHSRKPHDLLQRRPPGGDTLQDDFT